MKGCTLQPVWLNLNSNLVICYKNNELFNLIKISFIFNLHYLTEKKQVNVSNI